MKQWATGKCWSAQIAAVMSLLVLSRGISASQQTAGVTKGENPAVVSEVNLYQNSEPNLDPNIDLRKLPSDMDYLFPLKPDEIRTIREAELEKQEATYQPLRSVKPIRDFLQISRNADQMPEIKVTPDYPSSVVFTDITGAPWPIAYVGQTGSLADVERPEGIENALVLYAKNPAGQKSISVYLEGITLPITLTVSGQSSEYHALKHIRINERGPNSPNEELLLAASSQSAPQLNPFGNDEENSGDSLDEVLNKLAYKVTPDGFTKLKASDPSVDAWIEDSNPEYLYVMTDYRLVAPAPRAGGRSVLPLQDGVRIYIIPRINPVMVLDSDGSRVYLTFKE
ncbi:DotH/IcmK family type IV secretion protein [Marinobacter lutaoensis]|nr:DotH/IcmK family type IV secretion protein [Marinobacter lutaoensis]